MQKLMEFQGDPCQILQRLFLIAQLQPTVSKENISSSAVSVILFVSNFCTLIAAFYLRICTFSSLYVPCYMVRLEVQALRFTFLTSFLGIKVYIVFSSHMKRVNLAHLTNAFHTTRSE